MPVLEYLRVAPAFFRWPYYHAAAEAVQLKTYGSNLDALAECMFDHLHRDSSRTWHCAAVKTPPFNGTGHVIAQTGRNIISFDLAIC